MAVKSGLIVKKKPGESEESLMRRFSKLVQEEDILVELKKRERYIKPSTLRAQEEAQRTRRYFRRSRTLR
jgi:ribosomal protein S21